MHDLKINAAVIITSQESDDEKNLALSLALPLVSQSQSETFDYMLYYHQGHLKLLRNNDDLGALWVDFCSGKAAYRQKHQGKGKLPLARACGIKQQHRPSIIDATAGLGQDAFVLAGLGCEVICIEQQPIINALLADALMKAKTSATAFAEIANRMSLKQGNSETLLTSLTADVIYLDPMFPHQQHRKQAKVKKAMQMFRDFPGTLSNEQQLLNAAIVAAKDRVVVKRPDWAEPLAQSKPSHHIPGKNHRYDVYKVTD